MLVLPLFDPVVSFVPLFEVALLSEVLLVPLVVFVSPMVLVSDVLVLFVELVSVAFVSVELVLVVDVFVTEVLLAVLFAVSANATLDSPPMVDSATATATRPFNGFIGKSTPLRIVVDVCQRIYIPFD